MIDVSANLLDSWTRDRERERSVLNHWLCAWIGVVAVTGVLIAVARASQSGTQAWAEQTKTSLAAVQAELAQFGELNNSANEDSIKGVPLEYRAHSNELLKTIATGLTSTQKGMALENFAVTRTDGRLIGKGSAKVADIRTARQYLDAIQAQLPESQALITNVSQSSTPEERALTVQFELSPWLAGGTR